MMKKNFKTILFGITAVCMCAGLTGCGKETVDVSADADILVSGYDGHGIATVSEGGWLMDTEKTYGQGMSIMELAALEEALYDAVEYSVSPSENLSNGDEVVLTIDVDNSALESYDFKLAGGEKKITVSGLDEVEAFSSSHNNQLYCVFKETAEVTGFASKEEGKEKDAKKKPYTDSFYTYYKYSDIVILDDGTCSFDLSSGSMPSSTAQSKYGYMSWGDFVKYSFKGYNDLDSMFNDCITSQIDSCNYENTVTE